VALVAYHIVVMAILNGFMMARQRRWRFFADTRANWLREGLVLVHNSILNGLANIFVHNRIVELMDLRADVPADVRRERERVLLSASCWALCCNGKPSVTQAASVHTSTRFRQGFFDIVFALEIIAMVRERLRKIPIN